MLKLLPDLLREAYPTVTALPSADASIGEANIDNPSLIFHRPLKLA